MTSKFRAFTFALTVEDTPNINEVIEIVQKYPKYAYILHDSDVNDDGSDKKDHYHFFVEFPNPRSFQSLANDLNVATNFIEKVYDKKGILEYLTHKNQPEKFQYNPKEIVSNFSIDDEIKNRASITDMYTDFMLLRRGMLTAEVFLEKYRTDCANMSFYNKLRTIDMVVKADFAHRVEFAQDFNPFKK